MTELLDENLHEERIASLERQVAGLERQLINERKVRIEDNEASEVALSRAAAQTENVQARYVEEIESMNTAYAGLVRELKTKKKNTVINERVEHLSQTLVERTEMITSLEQALERTSRSLARARADEKLLVERIRGLEEQNISLTKLVKKVSSVQRVAITSSKELVSANEKNEQYETELFELRKSLAKASADLELSQKETAGFQEELVAATFKHQSDESLLQKAREELASVQRQAEHRLGEIASLRNENEQLQASATNKNDSNFDPQMVREHHENSQMTGSDQLLTQPPEVSEIQSLKLTNETILRENEELKSRVEEAQALLVKGAGTPLNHAESANEPVMPDTKYCQRDLIEERDRALAEKNEALAELNTYKRDMDDLRKKTSTVTVSASLCSSEGMETGGDCGNLESEPVLMDLQMMCKHLRERNYALESALFNANEKGKEAERNASNFQTQLLSLSSQNKASKNLQNSEEEEYRALKTRLEYSLDVRTNRSRESKCDTVYEDELVERGSKLGSTAFDEHTFESDKGQESRLKLDESPANVKTFSCTKDTKPQKCEATDDRRWSHQVDVLLRRCARFENENHLLRERLRLRSQPAPNFEDGSHAHDIAEFLKKANSVLERVIATSNRIGSLNSSFEKERESRLASLREECKNTSSWRSTSNVDNNKIKRCNEEENVSLPREYQQLHSQYETESDSLVVGGTDALQSTLAPAKKLGGRNLTPLVERGSLCLHLLKTVRDLETRIEETNLKMQAMTRNCYHLKERKRSLNEKLCEATAQGPYPKSVLSASQALDLEKELSTTMVALHNTKLKGSERATALENRCHHLEIRKRILADEITSLNARSADFNGRLAVEIIRSHIVSTEADKLRYNLRLAIRRSSEKMEALRSRCEAKERRQMEVVGRLHLLRDASFTEASVRASQSLRHASLLSSVRYELFKANRALAVSRKSQSMKGYWLRRHLNRMKTGRLVLEKTVRELSQSISSDCVNPPFPRSSKNVPTIGQIERLQRRCARMEDERDNALCRLRMHLGRQRRTAMETTSESETPTAEQKGDDQSVMSLRSECSNLLRRCERLEDEKDSLQTRVTVLKSSLQIARKASRAEYQVNERVLEERNRALSEALSLQVAEFTNLHEAFGKIEAELFNSQRRLRTSKHDLAAMEKEKTSKTNRLEDENKMMSEGMVRLIEENEAVSMALSQAHRAMRDLELERNSLMETKTLCEDKQQAESEAKTRIERDLTLEIEDLKREKGCLERQLSASERLVESREKELADNEEAMNQSSQKSNETERGLKEKLFEVGGLVRSQAELILEIFEKIQGIGVDCLRGSSTNTEPHITNSLQDGAGQKLSTNVKDTELAKARLEYQMMFSCQKLQCIVTKCVRMFELTKVDCPNQLSGLLHTSTALEFKTNGANGETRGLHVDVYELELANSKLGSRLTKALEEHQEENELNSKLLREKKDENFYISQRLAEIENRVEFQVESEATRSAQLHEHIRHLEEENENLTRNLGDTETEARLASEKQEVALREMAESTYELQNANLFLTDRMSIVEDALRSKHDEKAKALETALRANEVLEIERRALSDRLDEVQEQMNLQCESQGKSVERMARVIEDLRTEKRETVELLAATEQKLQDQSDMQNEDLRSSRDIVRELELELRELQEKFSVREEVWERKVQECTVSLREAEENRLEAEKRGQLANDKLTEAERRLISEKQTREDKIATMSQTLADIQQGNNDLKANLSEANETIRRLEETVSTTCVPEENNDHRTGSANLLGSSHRSVGTVTHQLEERQIVGESVGQTTEEGVERTDSLLSKRSIDAGNGKEKYLAEIVELRGQIQAVEESKEETLSQLNIALREKAELRAEVEAINRAILFLQEEQEKMHTDLAASVEQRGQLQSELDSISRTLVWMQMAHLADAEELGNTGISFQDSPSPVLVLQLISSKIEKVKEECKELRDELSRISGKNSDSSSTRGADAAVIGNGEQSSRERRKLPTASSPVTPGARPSFSQARTKPYVLPTANEKGGLEKGPQIAQSSESDDSGQDPSRGTSKAKKGDWGFYTYI